LQKVRRWRLKQDALTGSAGRRQARNLATIKTAPTDEALKLQKQAPDDAVVVLPEEGKAA
jgi:hypothetical protein